ncbi:thrombospondin type 3 repeat-containing protein [Patescibacteria group bacterium]|nr:thrombospondin type 3 repeat-containing protein [Patescibacteria group bacterium]MBU1757881.1 thrombospondin type 3 repeat-containing protein [Patescibacteria group bacterium]
MDEDGIPDICDSDIDGDGIENLLGILKYENGTCSSIQAESNNFTNGALDENNTNLPILDTHFQ